MDPNQNTNQPVEQNVNPVPPPPPAPEPVPASNPNPAVNDASPKSSGRNPKAIIFLVIALILIIVAAALAFMMMNRNSANNQVAEQTNTQPAEETTQVEEDIASDSALLNSTAFTDTTAGFSINAPAGWAVQKNPQQGILAIFTNPNIPGNNINIVSAPSEGLELQEFVDANKEQIQALFKNYTLVDDEAVVVNGENGYIIGGTFGDETTMLKNKQLIIIKDGNAYIVTATATEQDWPNAEAAVDASINSFKIN